MAGMDYADIRINTSIIKWHDLIAGKAENHLNPVIGKRLNKSRRS
jgi:hypothetical protein